MANIFKVLAVVGVVALATVMFAGCTTSATAAPSLKSIASSPRKISLSSNATQQLTITATYTKGPPQNVTTKSTYKSSSQKRASVTPAGLIKGGIAGSTTITVSYTEGTVTRTVEVPVTVK